MDLAWCGRASTFFEIFGTLAFIFEVGDIFIIVNNTNPAPYFKENYIQRLLNCRCFVASNEILL